MASCPELLGLAKFFRLARCIFYASLGDLGDLLHVRATAATAPLDGLDSYPPSPPYLLTQTAPHREDLRGRPLMPAKEETHEGEVPRVAQVPRYPRVTAECAGLHTGSGAAPTSLVH